MTGTRLTKDDLYTVAERFLMREAALRTYDRVLAIVALNGRARAAVETQRAHIDKNLFVFDGRGDIVYVPTPEQVA